MIAKAVYRYKNGEEFEEATATVALGDCWDSIHKYGNFTKGGYDGLDWHKFKEHLIRQYYKVPIDSYNQHKELIDRYLNLLHSFNPGITWKVHTANLIIDINVSKLRSVKERKVNSFLIRYIGFLTNNYADYNKHKIIETIIRLRENGANIMDSLLLGSLVGYFKESWANNLINTYYASITNYSELIPKSITKKQYIDKIKSLESTNDKGLIHKHLFEYIPNTNTKAIELRNLLLNKEYKKAIKYFKNEQKQN